MGRWIVTRHKLCIEAGRGQRFDLFVHQSALSSYRLVWTLGCIRVEPNLHHHVEGNQSECWRPNEAPAPPSRGMSVFDIGDHWRWKEPQMLSYESQVELKRIWLEDFTLVEQWLARNMDATGFSPRQRSQSVLKAAVYTYLLKKINKFFMYLFKFLLRCESITRAR